jgi:GTP-binding protein EngB required for normal cell division
MAEVVQTPLSARTGDDQRLQAKPPASSLETLAALAARHHLGELELRARSAQRQATDSLVSVAVLGRFKAGKTTMLNQLLGDELLPVQAIPATAVITRLCFGPELVVEVQPADGDTFGIEPCELADWITETGNPGNRRRVEWVQVASPALADLDRLVLVDTPGTGSSWQHNTEISLGWLPNVGAALVAVNATQPLSEDDLELVRLVEPHTPNIVVVLTKVDLLTEADQRAVTAHVRDQLRERAGLTPLILPVSNAARHRPQLGRLREALRELNRTHRDVSAGLVEHRTRQVATDCRSYLELARAAATTTDRAAAALREALDAESRRLPALAQQARAQLRPVGEAMIAATQAAASHAAPSVTRSVLDRLRGELPGWNGTLARQTARFREWLERTLADVARPFAAEASRGLDALLAEGLESVQRIGEAFLQRLEGLVSEATGQPLTLPVPELARTAIGPIDVLVSAVFDSHIEVLSWAVPMPLVRGAVHRHFLSVVPWQVEKNLSRVAYDTAEAASRKLQESLDDHIGRLAAVVRTCQQLIDTRPDELTVVEDDLRVLDQLTFPARNAAAG